jgi:hypothetical protein
MNELKCPHCKNQFDQYFHLPKLLPLCGHSICLSCLKSLFETSIQSNNPHIQCPSDLTSYPTKFYQVNNFPSNQSLLNLINNPPAYTTKDLPLPYLEKTYSPESNILNKLASPERPPPNTSSPGPHPSEDPINKENINTQNFAGNKIIFSPRDQPVRSTGNLDQILYSIGEVIKKSP